MEEQKDFSAIGQEILFTARNELYMNLPYLDVALCALRFQPGGGVTLSVATDGDVLYYDGGYLAERYLRSRVLTNRAYLHVILHCMLRHLAKKRGKLPELWDLACDVAVESILDDLHYPCLEEGTVPAKQKFYGECRADMPVLTAEGIYRRLLRLGLPEYEVARLQRGFLVDDHGLWDPEQQDDQQQSQQQDEKWKDLSDKTKTGMETVLAGRATGGEAVLEQVKVAVRDDVDYRAFLRRFAAPREVLEVDGDAFDYIFYTYGLQLYGNMPLVEPPETKEEKRIEDFVIAVDTSMSTSGELVRQFLACTYAILRSTETFTRKVNIRILLCDDQVRSDTAIHDLEELKDYMDHFQLVGGSATDFRPVFEHVAKLQKEGAFTSLRGLVYFTDGMGIYPKKRPPYDTAFVLLEEAPLSVKMPPWAIRLVLTVPELEKARQEAMEQLPDELDLEELPQL
ncbi:vWA domain-containing protein [Dysosmobacter sp.]|uniref:vWA domain-containing protein n=1 Tax=Dysosmobacter sp. TaxID=2591382 RepID=UPI002A847B7F|nr:VWA-like domain-containing protein [Dysosmobacter sp.]MDY3984761.1 VWA-like domain-containing protein [Dysosmobacter sp.]